MDGMPLMLFGSGMSTSGLEDAFYRSGPGFNVFSC